MCRYEAKLREGNEHADKIPVEIITEDERKLRVCLSRTPSEEIQVVEAERIHVKCGSFEFIEEPRKGYGSIGKKSVKIDGKDVPGATKVVITASSDDLTRIEIHTIVVHKEK